MRKSLRCHREAAMPPRRSRETVQSVGFGIAASAFGLLAMTVSGVFQQPALMFAFQGSGRNYSFPLQRSRPFGGAHRRRQDPKTPVEQALMRGLVAA